MRAHGTRISELFVRLSSLSTEKTSPHELQVANFDHADSGVHGHPVSSLRNIGVMITRFGTHTPRCRANPARLILRQIEL